MEEKSIYNLELHESIWDNISSKDILRVPGGWIYSRYNNGNDTLYDPVFVPYNNEFQAPIKM